MWEYKRFTRGQIFLENFLALLDINFKSSRLSFGSTLHLLPFKKTVANFRHFCFVNKLN